MDEDALMDGVVRGAEILRVRFPYMSEDESLLLSALSQHFTMLALGWGIQTNNNDAAMRVCTDYIEMLYSFVSAIEKRCMQAKSIKEMVDGK